MAATTEGCNAAGKKKGHLGIPEAVFVILQYKQSQRQPPNELLNQHCDVIQRFQWQKSYLEQGGPAAKKEYVIQLERFLQLYAEAVRRLGQEGKRDAAKEALHKRNLVENELQKFRR